MKECSGSNPKWLNQELMMTKKIGKKAVFSGQALWRKWLVGKTEIMNRWNSVWPKLLVNGILPS